MKHDINFIRNPHFEYTRNLKPITRTPLVAGELNLSRETIALFT